MGVRLSELRAGVRTVLVPFGDARLRVTYRLGERTMATVNDGLEDRETVVAAVVRMVQSWDLEDDAGAMVPLTEESLATVPVPLLRAVWYTVQGDVGLGEVESSSDAG